MRSMLFTPAIYRERADKVWKYEPDAVILDLEDSVSLDKKQEARINAAAVVAQEARPWYVRVNSLASDLWQADLQAVLHPNLEGILIPKVEGADMIKTLDEAVTRFERDTGRATPFRLMPTIETVAGYDQLRSIATASERIDSITFGEGDFSLDLGIEWDSTSPTIVAAKTTLVIESRLAKLNPPHDGVYPKLRDEVGLRNNCMFARRLGFGCKHCIHPEQLAVVHDVFNTHQRAVEKAERIVAAFEEALREGKASIQVDGEFVDYPVYYRAQQVIGLRP